MGNLRQMEAEEKTADRTARERAQRQAFLTLMREKVRRDEFTFKTRYEEFVWSVKDEQSFYGVIGQEPCNPRGMFLDMKDRLDESVHRLKKGFLSILRQNPEDFPVGITLEDFQAKLFKNQRFLAILEDGIFNSDAWVAGYLHSKLGKRQDKAIGRFIRFLQNANIGKKATLEELRADMRRDSFAGYFESLPEIELQTILEDFKSRMEDKPEPKRWTPKEAPGRQPEPRDTPPRRDMSSRDAGDLEQGEIKGVDVSLSRKKRVKYD